MENQKNQLDIQDDIQLDNQDEFQDEIKSNKNIFCNIFYEQINLINQLPLNERGNVVYMALLNAFIKNQENQLDIQLDNQLENAYISISKSISLSILSKSVLDILNKTINCKKYKNNWGGKREKAGRPKDDKPKKANKVDPYASSDISKIVRIYSEFCTDLISISNYSLDRHLRSLIAEYLEDTDCNFEYFKDVCIKANKLKQIGDFKIDLKSLIKNHSGIYGGKYKPKEEVNDVYNPCI